MNNEINHYNEWKHIPLSKMNSMQFSKDPQKKIWYQEYRKVYISIINPISNYLKSRLDKLLIDKSTNDITMAEFIKIIHDELSKEKLNLEDKAKIIEENRTRKR